MIRLTRRIPLLFQRHHAVRRAPEVVEALLGGALAAGLGLGSLAVLVLFMWTISPYASGGSGTALHIAAALWLLAHGAELLRNDGLTHATVPIGITPLLMTALPVWLMHRAAAQAVAPGGTASRGAAAYGVAPDDGHDEHDEHDVYDAADEPGAGGAPQLGPFATTAWVIGGYAVVAAAAVLYAGYGPLHCSPLSALVHIPLLAAGAAAHGAWTGCGRPTSALPNWAPYTVSRLLPRDGVSVALRAAAVGAGALAVGGALLSGGALAWHARTAGSDFSRLGGTLSGRLAVLLLIVALLPNAALWGASYALGPGFALGLGGAVSPAGAYGYPSVLPDFPLLAALPAPTGRGGASPLAWLVAAVPVAAGTALAWYVARSAQRRGWPVWRAGIVIVLAAVCCGAAMALLAVPAAGPMGTRTLARLGPVGWRTGGAACAWMMGVGIPVMLAARWWQRRTAAAGAQ